MIRWAKVWYIERILRSIIISQQKYRLTIYYIIDTQAFCLKILAKEENPKKKKCVMKTETLVCFESSFQYVIIKIDGNLLHGKSYNSPCYTYRRYYEK